MATNRNWKKTLRKHGQLLLPSACDALTAKLIEQAGFPAYQIGGFALDGMRFGFPDMDVNRLGEKSTAVANIVHACSLPVLVDCDDGYGDEKNVTHTVHVYDSLGAAAIFIEDQKAPKRCGHMGGKQVIPAKEFISKLRAAVAARRNKDELFLLARTDAIEPEGIDAALKRAEQYLKAGADGIYFDGVQDEKQMRRIRDEFKGEPLATTILERGGKTPWLPPQVMLEYGFNMVLYPVSLLFRQTRAIQEGLADLKAGRPLPARESVDMLEFEKIVDIAYWKMIEQKAIPVPEKIRRGLNKLFQRAA
jgi:2-methylisocitrate lyase-like PEP mutase family enzyme